MLTINFWTTIAHPLFLDQPEKLTNTVDPTTTAYRQGSTLGGDYKHWFRAEFGNGRFCLFFRYDSEAKVIIFA